MAVTRGLSVLTKTPMYLFQVPENRPLHEYTQEPRLMYKLAAHNLARYKPG